MGIRVPAGLHFHSRVAENRREPFPRMMTEISYSGGFADRRKIKLSSKQQQEVAEAIGGVFKSIEDFKRRHGYEDGYVYPPRPIKREQFDFLSMEIIKRTQSDEVLKPMLRAIGCFALYLQYVEKGEKRWRLPQLMAVHDALTCARASTKPDTKIEAVIDSLIDEINQTVAFLAERGKRS